MKQIKEHARVPFTVAEKHLLQNLAKSREKVNKKFPMWTALAATFGLVSILYGFEKLIDRVDFFVNNPWILIVTGLLILIATGTIYRKL